MRHLLVEPGVLARGNTLLKGEDARHLVTVLRIRPGERLIVLDGQAAFEMEVASTGKDAVELRAISPVPLPPEPSVAITVAQALGKGDRFDEALEHATEVGAVGFIPLTTARTVVKIDGDATSKLIRWNRILKSAAEQSHRARAPFIQAPVSCKELIGRMPEFDRVLLLDPGGAPLQEALPSTALDGDTPSVLLIVGPEGGFAPEEVSLFESAGAARTNLGPFVMRTETAAVAAISAILHLR